MTSYSRCNSNDIPRRVPYRETEAALVGGKGAHLGGLSRIDGVAYRLVSA